MGILGGPVASTSQVGREECYGLLSFLWALIDEGCCVRDGLQAFDWDGLAGDFAESVGSVFDPLERSLYLREFFPIPVIFVNLCFSLRDEACVILQIPDTGLVAHRFLAASSVGGIPR